MESPDSDSHSSSQRPHEDAVRPLPVRAEYPHVTEPNGNPTTEVPVLEYSSTEKTAQPSNKARMIRRSVILMYILAGFIMLLWPWVFFRFAKSKGGIEASAKLAQQVQKHPQDVNYFTTVVTAAVAWLVGHLFSQAVGFFTKTRISHSQLEIRHIKFLSVLMNHSFLGQKTRYGLVALFYMIIFLLVSPGLNALLIPTPILRHAPLSGTELDFASTDPTCVHWFNYNEIPHTCDWMVASKSFNDFAFTACLGENQITDALDSGRNNMLTLGPDKNASFTFTQLGGLHFSGPLQGVLPAGPNGISAFDTIDFPPHLQDKLASAITYNYTLELQGITGNISCDYDETTPISYFEYGSGLSLYNSSCPPSQFINCTNYYAPDSPNSLGFWACGSETSSNSYDLYFKGVENYDEAFGNITCTASSMQIAVVPLTYNSTTNHFVTDNPSPAGGLFNTSTELFNRTIFAIQDLVAESQTFSSNLVAEAIFTYGVKYFNISVDYDAEYNASKTYLRLLEEMIQGMIAYEAAYIRMIYSSYNVTPTLAPDFCMRDVTGTLNYMIIGWQSINATSLTLLILAAIYKEFHDFDPTDITAVIQAMEGGHVRLPPRDIDDHKDAALSTRVRYGPVPNVRPPMFALYSHDGSTEPEGAAT